eukprot:7027627-Heterocapsa_arctica.AAC.1
MVHQARALFIAPRVAPITRAKASLDKLQRCAPEKTSGRHAFLAEAYSALRSVLAQSGQTLTNEMRLKVMREHGDVYQALPLDKKRRYEERQNAKIAERRADLKENLAHTQALIGISNRRALEERMADGQQQC